MKIGIIEDEVVHMQILNRYIKNWGVERKENIQIKEYDSAESFLFAWEDEKDFDILFINILNIYQRATKSKHFII